MLTVTYAECHMKSLYAECRYSECHYAECRYSACHYAECRYSECHYAECRCALLECQSTVAIFVFLRSC
jgi:hypothetical protein